MLGDDRGVVAGRAGSSRRGRWSGAAGGHQRSGHDHHAPSPARHTRMTPHASPGSTTHT